MNEYTENLSGKLEAMAMYRVFSVCQNMIYDRYNKEQERRIGKTLLQSPYTSCELVQYYLKVDSN